MFGGKETPGGSQFRKELEEMGNLQVNVGYDERSKSYKAKGKKKDGQKDPVRVVEVAAWNEFGTERSPARPFMRQTLKNRKKEIMRHAQSTAKSVINGQMDSQQALNRIGAYVKGRMQLEIRDGEFEPDAPSTIARKGSSKPLIDTGRMRQSIVYSVGQKED